MLEKTRSSVLVSVLVAVTLASYAFTWVGGVYSHERTLRNYAQGQRQEWIDRYQSGHASALPKGREVLPMKVYYEKPRAGIDWAFPILPGLLVTQSWYVVGPLWGEGRIRLMFFYGSGTFDLFSVMRWIS